MSAGLSEATSGTGLRMSFSGGSNLGLVVDVCSVFGGAADLGLKELVSAKFPQGRKPLSMYT